MGVALSTPRAKVASRFGGLGSISGTVTDDASQPAVRTIRLYDHFSGRLIRTTDSAIDGTYAFTDLQVGLVVDVMALDDAAGTVYPHLLHSKHTVA